MIIFLVGALLNYELYFSQQMIKWTEHKTDHFEGCFPKRRYSFFFYFCVIWKAKKMFCFASFIRIYRIFAISYLL